MDFGIEIDANDLVAGLRDLDRALDAELHAAVVTSTAIVEREARGLAPKRTNALANSIHAVAPSGSYQGGDLAGDVAAFIPYALSVHDGSRPHDIVPRRVGALRFMIGGRVVFTRRVHHPGTRGYAFLELALELRAGDVEATFANAHAAAFERAGFGA